MAHRTMPSTFVNMHFPNWRNKIWAGDLDLNPWKELIEKLSYKGMVSIEQVEMLTLRAYENKISEHLPVSGRSCFIQPIKNRGRSSRHYGLRFCPTCLHDDENPFFRKKWRLSFSTACLQHKAFLLDRCKCGTPVSLYKTFNRDREPCCHRCNRRLSKLHAKAGISEQRGLDAIRWLLEILGKGYIELDGKPVYSQLFFPILRHLAILASIKIGESTFSNKKAYIEDMPIHAQFLIFAELFDAFRAFPESFHSFCEALSLTKTNLTRDFTYLPHWYETAIFSYDKKKYSASIEEIRSATIFLKKNGRRALLSDVSQLLGRELDPRKRRDLRDLMR